MTTAIAERASLGVSAWRYAFSVLADDRLVAALAPASNADLANKDRRRGAGRSRAQAREVARTESERTLSVRDWRLWPVHSQAPSTAAQVTSARAGRPEHGGSMTKRLDPGLLLALGLPSGLLALVCLLLTTSQAQALPQLLWAPPLRPVHVVRAFTAPAGTYGPGHRGVDFAARAGTEVLAPVDGVITYAGGLAGRPLVALNRRGFRVDLEPVEPSVRVGDFVLRGEVVGHLVSGTHCPRTCLHWGVREPHGRYINPLTLLRGRVHLLPVFGRAP